MRKGLGVLIVLAASVGAAATGSADATVESKTQVQFGGAMGGLLNSLGKKTSQAGVLGTMTVKGDRRLALSGDRGEIIDLAEEKIYRLNFVTKTYTVETFEQRRKRAKDRPETASGQAGEFDVDYSVQETGQKQSINGFETRQMVATVAVRPKGRTPEQGGGAVLTAEMWVGPRLPPVRELEAFNRRYYQKLYGKLYTGETVPADMLLASAPAFGVAMKRLQENKEKLDGTPVRTVIKFDADGPAGAPGVNLFSATNEVVKASAAGGDVAIPAGFSRK